MYKVCKCGTGFTATGPAALYCSTCKQAREDEIRRVKRERAERKRRERGCRIGRGALPGADHPNYKHGYYVAQTQSQKYRQKVRYCEECGVDTHELSRWHWMMHHIDHNHANHSEDNLQLLCKSCHAKTHDMHTNFSK